MVVWNVENVNQINNVTTSYIMLVYYMSLHVTFHSIYFIIMFF